MCTMQQARTTAATTTAATATAASEQASKHEDAPDVDAGDALPAPPAGAAGADLVPFPGRRRYSGRKPSSTCRSKMAIMFSPPFRSLGARHQQPQQGALVRRCRACYWGERMRVCVCARTTVGASPVHRAPTLLAGELPGAGLLHALVACGTHLAGEVLREGHRGKQRGGVPRNQPWCPITAVGGGDGVRGGGGRDGKQACAKEVRVPLGAHSGAEMRGSPAVKQATYLVNNNHASDFREGLEQGLCTQPGHMRARTVVSTARPGAPQVP